MKRALGMIGLGLVLATLGCGKEGGREPTTGPVYESSGTGGTGSGPTGTGGSEPADNPGADARGGNGTGR